MPNATATNATTTVISNDLPEIIALMTTIVGLTEQVKEREALLTAQKKRLAEILPPEGIRLEGDGTTDYAIEAKWVDKLTKTLQKGLVEQNHGITLTDGDYKISPSHYVNVAKVKR